MFQVMVLRPAEIAVIILTFAEYSIQPFHNVLGLEGMPEEHRKHITKLVALLALGLITYINLVSVKLYVKINNIFGVCKVFACLIVIFGGIYELAIGNTQNLKSGFDGTSTNFGYIALAFYNGLWSYDGWSSVTTITEEIKRPEKYFCLAHFDHQKLTSETFVLGTSRGPFPSQYPSSRVCTFSWISPTWRCWRRTKWLILSRLGFHLARESSARFPFWSRSALPCRLLAVLYPSSSDVQDFAMCLLEVRRASESRWEKSWNFIPPENHMPEPLSYIHVTRSTPAPAVFLQGILAFAFLIVGDIAALIEFASFLIW